MRWWNRYHSLRSSSGMTSRSASLQRLEQLGRTGALQHVVAEGAGEALEARRIHQEGRDVGVELGQQLLAEVLDEVAVVTGEVADDARHTGRDRCGGRARRGTRRRASPRSARRARRGRPGRRRRRGASKSDRRLERRRTPAPPGPPRRGAGGRGAVRAAAGPPCARRARCSTRAASRATSTGSMSWTSRLTSSWTSSSTSTNGRRRAASIGAELLQRRRADGRRPRPQRRHASRIDRLDVVERQRDVRQQRGRVVVGGRQRHPCRRSGVLRRELGHERRLAVAGRRRHRDDIGRRGRARARPAPCVARRPVTAGRAWTRSARNRRPRPARARSAPSTLLMQAEDGIRRGRRRAAFPAGPPTRTQPACRSWTTASIGRPLATSGPRHGALSEKSRARLRPTTTARPTTRSAVRTLLRNARAPALAISATPPTTSVTT